LRAEKGGVLRSMRARGLAASTPGAFSARCAWQLAPQARCGMAGSALRAAQRGGWQLVVGRTLELAAGAYAQVAEIRREQSQNA
jgi:hypothetical protein